MRFILASASPARKALLMSAGFNPEVIPSNFDESTIEEESPGRLCRGLAKAKAKKVAEGITDAYVLGCDSVLEFDGEVFGKPHDNETAAARWKRMRGKIGTLHSGHCLIDTKFDQRLTRSSKTKVHFADVTDTEIASYVASGEPGNMAGGFSLEGLGGPFVDRIDGDHGTVVGVSLPLLRQMLTTWGTPVSSLWRTNQE